MKKYLPELSKTLRLAYPIMLGQLGQLTVSIADNVMLGEYGKLEFSAASISNSIFFIFFPFILGITSSLSALVPEAIAKMDKERVKKLFSNGIIISIFLSLLTLGLAKTLYPFVKYMNQPKEITDIMGGYTSIIMISYIPMTIFFVFRFVTDGHSKTFPAMIAMVLGNIVNIVINYVLIFGKLGFPEMGLEGAAIGTLSSRIFMVAFFIFFFYNSSMFKVYIREFSIKLYDKKVIKDIFRIGVPSSFQFFFEIGAFATISFLVGTFGTDYVAANQIANQMVSISFFIMTGVGIATTIRIGGYFGAKDFVSIKKVMEANIFLIVAFMGFMGIIYFLFRNNIPFIFNEDKNVALITSYLLIVGAIFQLSDGIQMISIGALKGVQDVKIPTLVTFISYWIIGLPGGYFLGTYFDLKATGIWIGIAIGLTFSAIIFIYRFYHILKLKKI